MQKGATECAFLRLRQKLLFIIAGSGFFRTFQRNAAVEDKKWSAVLTDGGKGGKLRRSCHVLGTT